MAGDPPIGHTLDDAQDVPIPVPAPVPPPPKVSDLEILHKYLHDPNFTPLAGLLLVIFTAFAVDMGMLLTVRVLKRIFNGRPWWTRAMALQKRALRVAGHSEESLSDAFLLDVFAYSVAIGLFHMVTWCLCLHVCLTRGKDGHWSFFLGFLLEVGFAAWGFCRVLTLRAIPKLRRFLSAAPMPFFEPRDMWHQPVTLLMGMLMMYKYTNVGYFQLTTCGLNFCSGVTMLAAAWKTTCGTDEDLGVFQCKACSLAQWAVTWFARGLLWLVALYHLFNMFMYKKDILMMFVFFFAGGVVSVNNLLLLRDSAEMADKWMTRRAPWSPGVMYRKGKKPKPKSDKETSKAAAEARAEGAAQAEKETPAKSSTEKKQD